MAIVKWLKRFFSDLFRPTSKNVKIRPEAPRQATKPDIFYHSVKILDKTPSNNAVGQRDFIAVMHQRKPYWVLFKCPCGCGNVISLSLQSIHKPHWNLRKSPSGRPTLHPSIWQNRGCCSHFWIKDGRVFFCNNTGRKPWIEKPALYRDPQKKKSTTKRHWKA